MLVKFMLFITTIVVWDAVWRMTDAEFKALKQQELTKRNNKMLPQGR